MAKTKQHAAGCGQAQYGCLDCGALYDKWMPCRGHMLSCCPGRVGEVGNLELAGLCSIGTSKCQVPSHVLIDGPAAVTAKSLGSSNDSDPGPRSREEGRWLSVTSMPVKRSEDDTATMAIMDRCIATSPTKENTKSGQAQYGCLECDSLYEKWMPCRGHMLKCCPDRLDEVTNLELVRSCLIVGSEKSSPVPASGILSDVAGGLGGTAESNSDSAKRHEMQQKRQNAGNKMKEQDFINAFNASSMLIPISPGSSSDPSTLIAASMIIQAIIDEARDDVDASREGMVISSTRPSSVTPSENLPTTSSISKSPTVVPWIYPNATTSVLAPIKTIGKVENTKNQQLVCGQAQYGCLECGALYEKWTPCRSHLQSCCPGRLEEGGSNPELMDLCSIVAMNLRMSGAL